MEISDGGVTIGETHHEWDQVYHTDGECHYVYLRPNPGMLERYSLYIANLANWLARSSGIDIWRDKTEFSVSISLPNTKRITEVKVSEIKPSGRRAVTITFALGTSIEAVISGDPADIRDYPTIEIYTPKGFAQIYPQYLYFFSGKESFIENFDVTTRVFEEKLKELYERSIGKKSFSITDVLTVHIGKILSLFKRRQ